MKNLKEWGKWVQRDGGLWLDEPSPEFHAWRVQFDEESRLIAQAREREEKLCLYESLKRRRETLQDIGKDLAEINKRIAELKKELMG